MLNFLGGDLLNFEFNIVCQQVNCQGKMGAGLAKQIKEAFPDVYDSYLAHINDCKIMMESPLGTINVCPIRKSGRYYVVNMFAQDKYGRDKQHTDYDAFRSCLNRLESALEKADECYTIAFPYKIGCGLAGGDWTVIKQLLHDFSERVKQEVYIVMKE